MSESGEWVEPSANQRSQGQRTEWVPKEDADAQVHYRRPGRIGRLLRRAGISALTVSAAAAGWMGRGVIDNIHSSSAAQPAGIHQIDHGHGGLQRGGEQSTQTVSTEKALRMLGIKSHSELLVVNPQEADALARSAITDAANTALAGLQGGDVGQRLKELAMEDPHTLLTQNVYSYVIPDAGGFVVTAINLGNGNVLDPSQPRLFVDRSYGSNGFSVSTTLDKNGNPISPFHNNSTNTPRVDTFPDYNPGAANNLPGNIYETLTGILGENTQFGESRVFRQPDVGGKVIPTVSVYNTALELPIDQSYSLGTDGIFEFDQSTGPNQLPPSIYRLIQVGTPEQEAAVLSFAGIKNGDKAPDLSNLPGMNPADVKSVIAAINETNNSPYSFNDTGAVASFVGKVFK